MYAALKNCWNLLHVLSFSGISSQLVMVSSEHQSESYIWSTTWMTMSLLDTFTFHFANCFWTLSICLKYAVSTCGYSHTMNTSFLSCTFSFFGNLANFCSEMFNHLKWHPSTIFDVLGLWGMVLLSLVKWGFGYFPWPPKIFRILWSKGHAFSCFCCDQIRNLLVELSHHNRLGPLVISTALLGFQWLYHFLYFLIILLRTHIFGLSQSNHL